MGLHLGLKVELGDFIISHFYIFLFDPILKFAIRITSAF